MDAKFSIRVVNSGQDEIGPYVDFVQVAPTGDIAPFEAALPTVMSKTGGGRLYFTGEAARAVMPGYGRAVTLTASNP